MLASPQSITPTDATFPGENWFYYFKTSASLWKSKIESLQHNHMIMVPIYWAFHAENGNDIDFGLTRPEANLGLLAKIVKEAGKELIFLLPFGPFPFLPNGGLPSHLARTLSLDENHKAQVLIDGEGKLNKLYSFFDPRVYQAYRQFIFAMASYFEKEKIIAEVVGTYTGHTDGNGFHSYMEDYSKAFENGFSRYLSLAKKDKENPDESPVGQEQLKKFEYIKMMEELYITSAKEAFSDLWSGVLKYSFLGGTPQDFLVRGVQGQDVSSRYMTPLLETIIHDVIPSSVLLPGEVKTGPLGKLLGDLVNVGLIEKKLDTKIYHDELSLSFTPLVFFEIFQNPLWAVTQQRVWERLGLLNFLSNQYKWTYLLKEDLKHLDSYDVVSEKILVVSGHLLGKKDFQILQKVLMNGGRIILDKTGLEASLERKLESFFLENSIKTEKFNYVSVVTHATFGTGKLFIFEGDKLLAAPQPKQFSFWENMMNLFGPPHLKVMEDEDVCYYWKTRGPTPGELAYQEIRRVCFFNPSSYKKKVRLTPGQNFAFLKFGAAVNTKVESTSMGVALEMLPGASITLDFGYYET